jgi:hypothetical protein
VQFFFCGHIAEKLVKIRKPFVINQAQKPEFYKSQGRMLASMAEMLYTKKDGRDFCKRPQAAPKCSAPQTR